MAPSVVSIEAIDTDGREMMMDGKREREGGREGGREAYTLHGRTFLGE